MVNQKAFPVSSRYRLIHASRGSVRSGRTCTDWPSVQVCDLLHGTKIFFIYSKRLFFSALADRRAVVRPSSLFLIPSVFSISIMLWLLYQVTNLASEKCLWLIYPMRNAFHKNSFHVMIHWWVRKPPRGPNNCMFWAMIEAEGEVGRP